MTKDNGLLNSNFLRRCERIGYRSLHDILDHWKSREAMEEEKSFSNGLLMLPYSYLSSSERDAVDRCCLLKLGYEFIVITGSEREMATGPQDRAALQQIIDNGQVMKPWTHKYTDIWDSVFFFSDPEDAVLFRLIRV